MTLEIFGGVLVVLIGFLAPLLVYSLVHVAFADMRMRRLLRDIERRSPPPERTP